MRLSHKMAWIVLFAEYVIVFPADVYVMIAWSPVRVIFGVIFFLNVYCLADRINNLRHVPLAREGKRC